jgi:hypothetical protein
VRTAGAASMVGPRTSPSQFLARPTIGRLVIPPKRAVLHAKGAAISRPACGLPHFQQLNAEILHRLQGAVKLGLVSKGSYEDWTGGGLLDTQAERLERSNERISQLPAYADLIGKAHRARTHDCTVLSWAGSGITPPG